MSSHLTAISAKLPKKTLRLLEEIRKKLQAERPDMVVNKTDALRHAIHHSHSASFVTTLLDKKFEPEDDGTKNREEKVTATGGD